MRTLYITRHAKSAPAVPGMADHDRPLDARGLNDAPRMARRFADRNERLDALVSSTALRALTTARAFAATLGNRPIVEDHSLYHVDVQGLMGILAAFPDPAPCIMIFGHNPGLSELVGYATGGAPDHLVPCTTVRIDFPAETWEAVRAGTGRLVWRDSPRDH